MKHLAISKWLSQLGLPQYCTLFDEDYDGVEVKADFSLIHYVDTAHSSTHIHTNTDTHSDTTLLTSQVSVGSCVCHY